MNRIKKEFKKRGFKLENDYEYLPYYLKGKSVMDRGYVILDAVQVVREQAMLVRVLNIGIEIYSMQRDGSINFDFV